MVGTYTMSSEKPNSPLDRGNRERWARGTDLVNGRAAAPTSTPSEKFGDCTIELEFMVPKGSNSGIYVMGEYEVQILDSFGKRTTSSTQGDLGGLYSAAAAEDERREEAGRVAEVRHRLPGPEVRGRQEDANAKFVKVTLNDEVLHENVEMKGRRPAA